LAESNAASSTNEPLETFVLKPKKTALDVQPVALAWVPRRV
jgi:hypothetical protein